MLDERREWIRDFMAMHDFKGLPNQAVEYYDKKNVKPPLIPSVLFTSRTISVISVA